MCIRDRPEKKERTVVSSYSQTVVIGDDPVIIGCLLYTSRCV